MAAPNPDDPIRKPSDDSLDRLRFAESLAQFLQTAPSEASFRIGLFGEWGSGKTSVLHLVEDTLQNTRVQSTWLHPWMSTTAAQLRNDLLETVAEALDLSSAGSRWGSRLRSFIRRTRTLAEGADFKIRLADRLFGPLLEKGSSHLDKWQSNNLITAIALSLQEHPLAVFVDDLDRAKVNLIPDFLLTLREGLNLPGLYYVLAVSHSALVAALEASDQVNVDANTFLDKIIEYRFILPGPSEQALDAFTQSHIEEVGLVYDKDAIETITDLMPRNPRSIKLYLRYVKSLEPLRERFAARELDRTTLYISQILWLEFPRETRLLSQDPEALQDLGYGKFYDEILERAPGQQEPRERAPKAHVYAPQEEVASKRFIALCDAIRERRSWQRRYDLQTMFLFREAPPPVSWRELERAFERGRGEEGARKRLIIEDVLGQIAGDETQAFEALFKGLVEYRGALLGTAADVAREEDILPILRQDVADATEFLDIIVRDLAGFQEQRLSEDAWQSLDKHIVQWAHWRHPEYYEDTRRAELSLWERSVANLGSPLDAKVLRLLGSTDVAGGRGQIPDEFERLRETAREELGQQVSNRLLDRFQIEGGLERFYGAGATSPEGRLLFDPNSSFHSDAVRQELYGIAEGAGESGIIQENFLTYLRMLTFGAFDPSSNLSSVESRHLLSDPVFTENIWTAAVAQRLNLRQVGTLLERRARLTQEMETLEEEHMPKPQWLIEMEGRYLGEE